MQVVVEAAEGGAVEDGNCCVAIRVASSRRQAPLQVGKVLRFPSVSLQQASPFKVDLLRQLGVGVLPALPTDGLYELPLEAPASGAVQARPASVTLRVTSLPLRCGKAAAAAGGTRSQGAPNEARGALQDRLEVELQAKQREDRAKGIEMDPAGMAKAAQAKKFFEDHNLMAVMQALLEAVVRDQPEDFWGYVAAFMDRLAAAPLGKVGAGAGPASTSGAMPAPGDPPAPSDLAAESVLFIDDAKVKAAPPAAAAEAEEAEAEEKVLAGSPPGHVCVSYAGTYTRALRRQHPALAAVFDEQVLLCGGAAGGRGCELPPEALEAAIGRAAPDLAAAQVAALSRAVAGGRAGLGSERPAAAATTAATAAAGCGFAAFAAAAEAAAAGPAAAAEMAGLNLEDFLVLGGTKPGRERGPPAAAVALDLGPEALRAAVPGAARPLPAVAGASAAATPRNSTGRGLDTSLLPQVPGASAAVQARAPQQRRFRSVLEASAGGGGGGGGGGSCGGPCGGPAPRPRAAPAVGADGSEAELASWSRPQRPASRGRTAPPRGLPGAAGTAAAAGPLVAPRLCATAPPLSARGAPPAGGGGGAGWQASSAAPPQSARGPGELRPLPAVGGRGGGGDLAAVPPPRAAKSRWEVPAWDPSSTPEPCSRLAAPGGGLGRNAGNADLAARYGQLESQVQDLRSRVVQSEVSAQEELRHLRQRVDQLDQLKQLRLRVDKLDKQLLAGKG